MAKNWRQTITEWFVKRGARSDSAEGGAEESGETLSRETVHQMVAGILSTRSDEIGCDECFDEMDRFAELTLAGKNVQEAMPLVHDHLQRCPDCREEYEALLAALRASE